MSGAGQVGRDEGAALLALRRLPEVGDVHSVRLLRRFGSARLALEAALADRDLSGDEARAWAEGQLALADGVGAHLLAWHDERYPPLLRHLADAPAYLFVRGRPELLLEPAVAVVGSRRSTPYGRDVAHRFGWELAARGLAVTSGLALGIDAAAHEGALEGGATVAVLGCGADVPYPRVNRGLYERVVANGAVVSELPLGAGPEAGAFPRRNRIISGLSLGVIVAEAPERSGALITARCALEQGREVFAVPGEIHNRLCAGCLALLRDGACLVRGVDDVIDEIRPHLPPHLQLGGVAPPSPATCAAPAQEEETGLLALLGSGVHHVDALARDSGLPTPRVLEALLRLELAGQVHALPGQVYSRRRR